MPALRRGFVPHLRGRHLWVGGLALALGAALAAAGSRGTRPPTAAGGGAGAAPARFAFEFALTEAELATYQAWAAARLNWLAPARSGWYVLALGAAAALLGTLVAVALDATTARRGGTVTVLLFLFYLGGMYAVSWHWREAHGRQSQLASLHGDMTQVTLRCEMRDDLVTFGSARGTGLWPWSNLIGAETSGGLLLLRVAAASALVIPLRAFSDAEEVSAALSYVKAKIAAVPNDAPGRPAPVSKRAGGTGSFWFVARGASIFASSGAGLAVLAIAVRLATRDAVGYPDLLAYEDTMLASAVANAGGWALLAMSALARTGWPLWRRAGAALLAACGCAVAGLAWLLLSVGIWESVSAGVGRPAGPVAPALLILLAVTAPAPAAATLLRQRKAR